ncbi:PleD family two-component system response regulator [Cochlodiniinecator piscidefendens]|uniref:PleD family two-component system response regulator n=1 Tax=Cochlodiniinecator piscidefendens TaxID=2715756 RepID=UPI00140BF212|nr:PleD family two-component system response regulator [Cochlodiniinecator piscidefendens]
MPGRILIVDDVATNRIVLKVKLSSACYEVLQAQSGTEAIEVARRERPDLIMLDVMMPDKSGIDVCLELKKDPVTAHIPVIIVTALSTSEARIKALEAGADEFITKPIDELTMLARVRSLLRASDTEEELRLRETTCQELGFSEAAPTFQQPANIVLVGGQKSSAIRWRKELSDQSHHNLEIATLEEALLLSVSPTPPDAYVIAGNLNRPDEGLRLLSELRSKPGTRHAAILMVLQPTARQQAIIALDLGANDLIHEPCDPQEMALRLNTQITRKRQADRLRATVQDGLRMAVTDPLTGLYNRRYAQSHLSRMNARSQSSHRPFAVMMLDIDRFKRINDTYGHVAGDAVLASVAQKLRENLRGVDFVARMGGEEFLVAMPDTDIAEARLTAERLRKVILNHQTHLAAIPNGISVTLSIGFAMGGVTNETFDQTIARADKALYRAKAEGRNQVNFFQPAA